MYYYLINIEIKKEIKMTGSDVHDMSYYQKCMMGGILSCGITHTIVCPLDIVKCRMQVSYFRLIMDIDFDRVFLFRPPQDFTPVLVMDSSKSKLLRDSRVSLS